MGSIEVPSAPRRPGIMLVTPRLHDPTPDNAALFLRWTKLHDQDLLGIPSDEGCGKVECTLRFNGDGEGSEVPLFYTIHADHVGVFQSPAYYAISRRLDLENVRRLGEREEPVLVFQDEREKWGDGKGEGKMVHDVVDARFAIYEEVGGDANGKTVGSFQTLPSHLTSSSGTAPHSALVAFSIRTSFQAAQKLQTSFTTLFSSRAPPSLKLYSSLYHHAGAEAQPDHHPVIEKEAVGGGEWLVLVLVVDGEGETLQVEHVGMMVGGFAKGQEMDVKWGVWRGEVFMS